MVSKVAVVDIGPYPRQSLREALSLIGGVDDLNSTNRPAVIKVGIFDPKTDHHSAVGVVEAIVNTFDKAPRILLTESDGYRGTGSEKLQIWKTLFTERIVPFNLSEDPNTRDVKIDGQIVSLSHVLFKPNAFVCTHHLRKYERGSILKNLLGLIPDAKKVRFHKKLEAALLDLYEAIGEIDLAVLDGTYLTLGVAPQAKKIRTNILAVGRDAIAVETVGAMLAGLDPKRMLVIREAHKRGLGETDIEKMEILGMHIEEARRRVHSLLKTSKRKYTR